MRHLILLVLICYLEPRCSLPSMCDTVGIRHTTAVSYDLLEDYHVTTEVTEVNLYQSLSAEIPTLCFCKPLLT